MVSYVGLPIAFSYVVPISLTGAIAYVGYNVFGNIVGHANVELVPHTATLRTKSLLSNPFIYHALHHARWQGHYSFAAALMDRLFRTEWPDWLALHARVVQGQPLTHLRERAGAKDIPSGKTGGGNLSQATG
jgi:Delta7-sterol 5-desaturase